MDVNDVQQVLGKVLNGVYIIGAKHNEEINGMSAAWVSQVSFEPKLVMVAIGKERYTYGLVKSSGVFSISVLDEGQIELGKKFGSSSGRDKDKFSDIEYQTYSTGAPVLKDCLAYLDCRVVNTFQAGDHTLFIGKVLSSGIKKQTNPLVFRFKDYF